MGVPSEKHLTFAFDGSAFKIKASSMAGHQQAGREHKVSIEIEVKKIRILLSS